MSAGGAAGGAAAAAAAGAVVAQAIKASGAIVEVEPEDFRALFDREEKPLVVVSQGGFLRKNYQYLAGLRGLVFFTKSAEMLRFKGGTQVIQAKKIWIPG